MGGKAAGVEMTVKEEEVQIRRKRRQTSPHRATGTGPELVGRQIGGGENGRAFVGVFLGRNG